MNRHQLLLRVTEDDVDAVRVRYGDRAADRIEQYVTPIPEDAMSLVVSYQSDRKYDPAPEGLHNAVCVDVVDLGMQPTQYGPKHKVQIRWQIAEKMTDGRPFVVSNRFNVSLNEKATLRKVLRAWRGRDFTPDELKGFDLEKLIGAPCMVQVQHNTDAEGNTWANVMSVVPLPKGMTRLTPDNYTRVKDRPAQPENGNGKAQAAVPGDPFADDPLPPVDAYNEADAPDTADELPF